MKGKVFFAGDIPWKPHPRFPEVQAKVIVPGSVNQALSFHLVRIEPGAAIKPHIHEREAETFYVLSGRGICTLGEEEIEFVPGSCGYAPAGTVHGMRNEGDEPLELVAIFTPPIA